MANNRNIRVDIDGDPSGLRRALREGTEAIDEFGDNAGGAIGDLTSRVSGLGSNFGIAMTGIAGATAIGIGGLTALVNSSREYVSQMNEISRSTGLSVTQLQQLSQAFSGLGLEMDKFGDFNKDTLDKLGDAFRAGGGVSDDLKEYGLNLQDYNKYLKQADGGMKAVIHTFYAMRDAGKSQAEIVNVMETLASDSSHMISTLEQFNNEADATQYIQSQVADVTDESAKKYAEFDKSLDKLTTRIKGTIAEGLTPLVDSMNDVLDAANTKPHEAGLFDELNTKIKESKGTLQDMLDIWQQLRQAGALNYQGAALHTGSMDDKEQEKRNANLLSQARQLQNDLTQAQAEAAAPKGGWTDTGKAADDAKKKLEQEQKAAKAAQDKANRERLTAQRNLESALAQVGEDGFKVRLQQFDRQQQALIKTITDSAKVLGINPDEMLKNAAAAGAKNRNDLINSLAGYSDPNQGLKDTNSLIGSGILNDQQKGYLADQQNQRINGDNPFAYNNTDQKLSENQAAMDEELKQNDLLLKGHEDYEKRKAEITAKYNAQAIDISNQNAQAQLSIFGNAADGLAQGMVAAFGESSGAAQAAFAVSKGITIAQTILSIQSALAQALATPFPASLAAYAKVLSLGMSIISTAKGASGQFHGGVDELPAGYDNKSFVLKAGERVVQPEANKKLTAFLDKHEGGSSSGDITVNAPLIIQGDVAGDDAKFNAMLMKHQNGVSQAVRNSQKRNS